MIKNMNNIDRWVRTIVAIAAATLYFTGTISGTWGIVLMLVAAIFLFTSFTSFCPIYRIFGVSTCKVKPVKP